MRKDKQWSKLDWKPNPKVYPRFGGNKQTSWKREYDDKKMCNFAPRSYFVCKGSHLMRD